MGCQDLLPELWLQIVSMLPLESLASLYRLNRLFFNLVLDAKYASVTITNNPTTPYVITSKRNGPFSTEPQPLENHLRWIRHLSSPWIFPRIRSVKLDMFIPGRRQVQALAKKRIIMHALFPRKKSPSLVVDPEPDPLDIFMGSALDCLTSNQDSNIRNLSIRLQHANYSHFPSSKQYLNVMRDIITHLSGRLTSYTVNIPGIHVPFFLPKWSPSSNLKCLDLHVPAAFKETYPRSEVIDFMESVASHLEVLNIRHDLWITNSFRIFSSFPFFPRLREFRLMRNGQNDPLFFRPLLQFLSAHASGLTVVEVGGHIIGGGFEPYPGSATNAPSIMCLPWQNLRSLKAVNNFLFPLDNNAQLRRGLQSLRPTLQEFCIFGELKSVEILILLSHLYPDGSPDGSPAALTSLEFDIFDLTVGFIDELSTRVPFIETLKMNIICVVDLQGRELNFFSNGGYQFAQYWPWGIDKYYVENRPDIVEQAKANQFPRELLERKDRYANWKLRRIHFIAYQHYPGPPAMWGLMKIFLRAVPQIESFNPFAYVRDTSVPEWVLKEYFGPDIITDGYVEPN